MLLVECNKAQHMGALKITRQCRLNLCLMLNAAFHAILLQLLSSAPKATGQIDCLSLQIATK